ncbi:MAG: ComEA family DNA-binding protein, partial [Peptoniphilus grossensis]
INTADSSELQKIPGVGAKTAEKIINYRSQNPFSSIEDIKNVDGIGDKKFESMEDYISTY